MIRGHVLEKIWKMHFHIFTVNEDVSFFIIEQAELQQLKVWCLLICLVLP